MEKDPILVIDKPDFVVRLHEFWIDVDLRKGQNSSRFGTRNINSVS